MTAWAYGALQLRRRHFLISRTRNTKLTYVVELGESFPTIQKLGVGEPPFLRNLPSNLKFWPQISPPPRGLGAQFCYHAMRDVKASLSSKPYDAGTLPEFLANFFPKFSAFCRSKKFRGWFREIVSRFCAQTLQTDRTDILACDDGKKFGVKACFWHVWPPWSDP